MTASCLAILPTMTLYAFGGSSSDILRARRPADCFGAAHAGAEPAEATALSVDHLAKSPPNQTPEPNILEHGFPAKARSFSWAVRNCAKSPPARVSSRPVVSVDRGAKKEWTCPSLLW